MHRSELLPYVRHRVNLAHSIARRRLTGCGFAGDSVVDDFHHLYFDSASFGGTWRNTFWMGVPVWKTPFDLWVYQEMMYDLRPGLVIETGTAFGGSALFLASVFDLLGNGSVISVDLRPRDPRPVHPRIQYLEGSSTDPGIVAQVGERAAASDGVLVLLDSDHSCAHVLDELRAYSPMVGVGGYVVVEDTDVSGHPVQPEFWPGPMEAVDEFLAEDPPFVVDRSKEKFHMTLNPRGFLKHR